MKMQKNKILVDTMSQEYSATFKVHNSRKMQPILQLGAIRQNKEESFDARYDGGVVTLNAENSLAAAFGISQIITGVLSGHLSECLGTQKPKFVLRPLWLSQQETFSPRRLIELGYNALVISAEIPEAEQISLKNLCSDHGIKWILAFESKSHGTPSTCPLDPAFSEYYQNLGKTKLFIPPDYVLWESRLSLKGFHRYSAAEECTTLDLLKAELAFAEQLIPKKSKLIYYLPVVKGLSLEKQAIWFKELIFSTKSQTCFSFSAYSGDPIDDHQKLHPFWTYLRKAIDPIEIDLLPIMNAGMIETGEGLWPTIAYEVIDEVFPRMERHRFIGAITKAKKIPQGRGFLDCSLWMAGQAMWKSASSNQLLETWLRAYYPKESILECMRGVILARRISQEIRRMSGHEEIRGMAEALFLQLKQLPKTVLQDYFTYFKRDARRLIFLELHKMNFPSTSYQESEDQEESFWTTGSKHFNEGFKISVNEKPNSANPAMKAILLNN